ncbi:MAG: anaerobic ribonucleoside-triphosphate reductase activating protein [Desulfobacteraceae bacterium]|nr:anaerobic ribonucleoside-triphosphate reductase activating protein [Desulfobacteraceae bacterium]
MRIGGFQRVSLIDYPGKVCAVVFTQGCNFRCPYCHNPELVNPELFNKPIPEKEVLSFFEMRKRLIDGVVLTGGEPLLQEDVEDFLMDVRGMGYLVKLDTNGSNPVMLEKLLKEGLLDYIAIDYKAPLIAYRKFTGIEVETQNVKRSIELVISGGIPYEMRTTVFRELSTNNLLEMMMELQSFSVDSYFLQMFVPWQGCKKDLSQKDVDIDYLLENLKCKFSRYGIRNISKKEQSLCL